MLRAFLSLIAAYPFLEGVVHQNFCNMPLVDWFEIHRVRFRDTEVPSVICPGYGDACEAVCEEATEGC